MGICQSHIQQQTEKCECVMINVPQSGCGQNFRNFNVVIFSGAIKSIAAKVWGGGGVGVGGTCWAFLFHTRVTAASHCWAGIQSFIFSKCCIQLKLGI